MVDDWEQEREERGELFWLEDTRINCPKCGLGDLMREEFYWGEKDSNEKYVLYSFFECSGCNQTFRRKKLSLEEGRGKMHPRA